MAAFTINDITLDISPQKITVDRVSPVKEISTIRSLSSMKAKGGMSICNVSIDVVFNEKKGFEQLSRLVAEFSISPFCYVENEYLRNTMLNGDQSKNMALVARSFVISTQQGYPNALFARIDFEWFNYTPYTKTFTFAADLFKPVEVSSPEYSNAWKIFVLAEIKRKEQEGGYKVFSKLDNELVFRLKQLTSVTKRELDTLTKQFQAIEKAKSEVMASSGHLRGLTGALQVFERELGNPQAATQLATSLTGVSMLQDITDNQIMDSISLASNAGGNTRWSLVNPNSRWKIVQDSATGKPLEFGTTLTQKGKNEQDKIKTFILSRNASLKLRDISAMPTNITVAINYNAVPITMTGHAYPTFQHIRGPDVEIALEIHNLTKSGLAELNAFYESAESQSRKFRHIPLAAHDVRVDNSVLKMCGLNRFIFKDITNETVPGSPGTYKTTITLLQNTSSNTSEKLKDAPKFFTNNDVREEVVNAILKNIDIRPLRTPPFYLKKQSGTSNDLFNDLVKTFLLGSTSKHTILNPFRVKGMLDYYNQFITSIFKYVEETKQYDVFEQIEQLTNNDLFLIEKFKDILQEGFDFENATDDKALSRKEAAKQGFPIEYQILQIRTSSYNEYKKKIKLPNQSEQDKKDKVPGPKYLDWVNSNNIFNEEQLSIINFIDHIINGDLIFLQEFKEALKKQQLLGKSITGRDAYPDFPLREAINIARQNQGLNDVIERAVLKEQADNVIFDDVFLLHPASYFYNPTDLKDQVIEKHTLQNAIDQVRSLHYDSRLNAEKNWVEDIYEERILSPIAADKIKRNLKLTQSKTGEASLPNDSSFWNPENEETREARDAFLQKSRVEPYFHPSFVDFQTQCTLVEAQKSSKPIFTQAIVEDLFNPNSEKKKTLLSPSTTMRQIVHNLGEGVLDNSVSSGSQIQSETLNPGQAPVFKKQKNLRITSPFNLQRLHPKFNYIRPHKGTDYAHVQGPKFSRETQVLPVAPGEIISITGLPKKLMSEASPDLFVYTPELIEQFEQSVSGNPMVVVTVKHSGGFISKYLHLQREPIVYELSQRLNNGEKVKVDYNTPLGLIGNTGASSTGPHLHLEIYYKGQPLDPEDVFRGEYIKYSLIPSPDAEVFENPLLTKSLQSFERNLQLYEGYSMSRAYPSFKLYFIETDMGERRRFAFDEFFDYSSLQDITFISTQENPVDMCIIRMTNISGNLTNRNFRESYKQDLESTNPQDRNTLKENPISSIILRPGIQIQLRLGYTTDPSNLETVLNGAIVDVSYDDREEMVEIVCQSLAMELVHTYLGEDKTYGGLFSTAGSTGNLIYEMLSMPQVRHFGFWEPGVESQSNYDILHDRWRFLPNPKTDNVFAPTGRGGLQSFFDSTSKYTFYNTTPWDVIDEMTYRVPSYIARPIPYEGKYGPRMSLYFGSPEQLYFTRDSTVREDSLNLVLRKIRDGNKEAVLDRDDILRDDLINLYGILKTEDLMAIRNAVLAVETKDGKDREKVITNFLKKVGVSKGFIKPFRSYHIATSALNIIYNNIKESGHNVANTVTVQYEDSSVITEATVGGTKVNKKTGQIEFGDPETFTMKCDAAIPDEEVVETLGSFPNCKGFENAKLYALSLLKKELSRNYQGSLVLLGNPSIKVHDIIYVLDEVNDIVGPVEVGEVIHRFSLQTGFITEVVPRMCVHIENLATMDTSDVMGMLAEHALKSIQVEKKEPNEIDHGKFISVVGQGLMTGLDYAFSPTMNLLFGNNEHSSGQKTNNNPLLIPGTFIFRKLITRTQLTHPFRYSPLTQHGRPMVANLPITHNRGSIVQLLSGWFTEASEGFSLKLSDTLTKINPANWFGHSEGDFLGTFLRGGK